MILHQLILQHLKTGDNERFYQLQAEDSISWLKKQGIPVGPGLDVLDLGCGHGLFGSLLQREGCQVTYADAVNTLDPKLSDEKFLKIDLDEDSLDQWGQYDLIICSNVLEHLRHAERFINGLHCLLNKGGAAYISWTNWLSPWGGHEFSPWHYFGPTLGPWIHDRLIGKQRYHTPYKNLFPTYIGSILKQFRIHPELTIKKVCPRYYSELSLLMKLPGIRELFAWNCAILLMRDQEKKPE